MAMVNNLNGGFDFRQEFSYSATGEQEIIELPFLPNGYVMQLNPTNGSAKVQASLDGTNWIDWNDGAVISPTASMMHPMRYIRVINISATASTFIIWGKRNG